jgi:hypothetical protein
MLTCAVPYKGIMTKDEETLPKSVDEVIKEEITGFALSMTNAIWMNNTTTDTATP